MLISYRRKDRLWTTDSLYERRAAHCGSETIFTDIDSMPLGVDVEKTSMSQSGQRDICFVVVGEAERRRKR